MHGLRISSIIVSLLVVLPSIVKAQGNRPSRVTGLLGDLQTQIDDNADAIESLEQKTTLSDLPCSTDEIAKFNGSEWICTV